MRALILALAVVGVAAAPESVRAQTPPAQTPAAQPPATQPPTTPAEPAAEETPARSLFEPTWQQFEVGGRFSSVAGDAARWQRYEDLGSGLLFTNARYAREWEKTGQLFQATADNVGWRDQRFTGLLERPGRFRIAGSWDQIPQFYSIDTQTPYAGDGAILTLDDATQRAIQNQQANLNAYVPQAVRFDMRERRDTGIATAKITPTANLDLSTTFRTQNHSGELPWGASFGFSNDVEVALPYTSRTNDISIGAEWNNSRNMFRVGYDGSWFENEDDTLVWDSPLRLDDSPTLPGRGRMSLWPSNQSQTVSAGGFSKLARRTQVTGFVSYGAWTNDSMLQPFTINSALPVLALPRQTTEAEAQVFSTNLSLVSRPIDEWRFSSRVRVYDFDNQTPAAAIPQFINYDTSVATTHTGGPAVLSHNRTTFTADATWTGLAPMALAVGYTRNHNGYNDRTFESANEDILSLTADAVGLSWATVRANLEFADRTGSGLNEASLVEIGEQPAMRHYDIADRQRIAYVSLDPAMRGWINEGRSYVPPVAIGGVMRSFSVGIVDASKHPAFNVGDAVQGMMGVQQYAISDGKGLVKVDPSAAPLERWVGGLGMPGWTAYFGLLEVGQPKAGDTVVVSAASGAVGSIVGQIAKIKGCRAVGIAGGAEKCRYVVDELGFDACIDYKSGNLAEQLKAACPQGIDVNFENVGGEIFDTILMQMNVHGRIALCGLISAYNATKMPEGPKNLRAVLTQRLTMRGLIVLDWIDRVPEAIAQLGAWHREGKLKIREDVRTGGLESFTDTLNLLYTGGNNGKLVLKV